MALKYKRILLKLSGEVLLDRVNARCIDPAVLAKMVASISSVVALGAQVGVVLGGGNIFRGLSGVKNGVGRVAGDHMGMLATVINSLALQNALEKAGIACRVQTAIEMRQVAEPFLQRKAMHHFERGRVVIFGAGTGNPFFSTDTAAALRACEIGADVLLKATKVDGVYTADPEKDATARRYARLTYEDALAKSLKVMDATAFSLCHENRLPIIVFNFFEEGALLRAVSGEPAGTLVSDFPDGSSLT